MGQPLHALNVNVSQFGRGCLTQSRTQECWAPFEAGPLCPSVERCRGSQPSEETLPPNECGPCFTKKGFQTLNQNFSTGSRLNQNRTYNHPLRQDLSGHTYQDKNLLYEHTATEKSAVSAFHPPKRPTGRSSGGGGVSMTE